MHKCQKSLPPLAKGQAPLLLTSVTDVYPDDAVWIRIQGAWWLAKEEVAITKFSSYVECLLNSHGYKPTAYCDDKAAWDILTLLAKWFRTQLKLRLADSPYYSIMVDETMDKSTTSQLIIYVKYLKHNSEGDLEVVIEYLGLISLDGGTALDITVVSYINNTNNRLLFTNLFEHSAFL